ncbi:probable LRR receptor-like protein kinase At1g51890 isoform X1 [Zingiber officinale]|uniref:probable LRR receptor-like protein kinase At1g51890 isoform X1 n=1 Tax=Zingiber officinale TaxID=94328 RepID=UPI001C4CA2D0|nr:probable LRR receptor-like protein kinase At1g51890 isoform X1 [Zingiber officinale]XP_042417154.1 probable LRR receptor-like protein kinase At1g51890 isoform X1 [Zingiber officinale]XP_042417155.1 probable LRR receptor-like protein kinase At1g51890 isoform X1 [Zingiber officinale]
MATINDVATIVSLIGKVIKAATDAQMMKREFKELADYLELVGRQLKILDDRVLDTAAMEAFQKMEEVLFQCHDLADSCQQRSTFYLVFNGKRIHSQLKGAQETIAKYLTLIPLIHFTQVFRRFKDEDTKINVNWHEHASDESDIPGLVAERIAEFTNSRFQSDAHLFTYEQIIKMTHNFKKVIGKGGFGIVYYGLLEDGTDVAIKLKRHSSQQSDMEFFAELRSLTQVHHKNLISLIGYCKDGNNLAIVYEYMPRGNLQDHLRGEVGFPVLTWVQRLQIAYQAAQGLDYLHTGCNPPIVHRDVKSANILLGADLEAKITDFGISKTWNENVTSVTTTVVGTPGYLDPEYLCTCRVSKATDVYSFGIVLLEMITGQPPIISGSEVQHIVGWISQRVAGEAHFVDTSMNECYDTSSVWKVLQLALSCTDSSASKRPQMAEVAIQLKEIIEMKPLDDMENEEVEEAFVTSIAQDDRPLCAHQLSANLFTSWTENTPGRRFWRCKNWKMAGDCGYFKWHDPVQEGVTIEKMDFIINQRDDLGEEINMMVEESATLLSRLKVLEEKIVECKRTKQTLEMKLESMEIIEVDGPLVDSPKIRKRKRKELYDD